MCIARRVLFTLLLLLGSTAAWGRGDSPEALARAYFSVLQNEGITGVSRFMHPEALASFKEMILPIYQAEAAQGQHQLRQLTFGPAATIADVSDSDPQVFMSHFLKLVAAQTGGARLRFDRLDILGTVAEGVQRHVLARSRWG